MLEEYVLKLWVWWRFLNNIFLIWFHGEDRLNLLVS